MDGMQTLLIIVGLIVILGVLGHGLWAIRKNSKQKIKGPRLSEPTLSTSQASRHQSNEEASGFDEFGIGQVRTIKAEEAKKAAQAKQKKQQKAAQQPTLFDDKELARKEPSVGVEQLPMSFDETETEQPSISSTNIDDVEEDKTPAIGAWEKSGNEAPRASTTRQTDPATSEADTTPAEPHAAEQPVEEKEPKPAPEVISLYVSGDIQGAILLQTVTELGFKFGDMDIFHRHEDTAGKGDILFSMANMFNPGVFDLDEIETFASRGVVLFMELPVPADGHKTFTMMHNAANKIADAMPRAAVLDSNRNPITKQSVQHTYQRIREFERRQHVAGTAAK